MENNGGNKMVQTMLSRLSLAKHALTHRTADQIAEAQARAIAAYQPLRAVPYGKTLADMVSGRWPGDESDEQIEAALRELS